MKVSVSSSIKVDLYFQHLVCNLRFALFCSMGIHDALI